MKTAILYFLGAVLNRLQGVNPTYGNVYDIADVRISRRFQGLNGIIYHNCVLGLSYSMTRVGLSLKLTQDTGEEVTEDQAQEWIELFNNTYEDSHDWKRTLLEDYETFGKVVLLDGWTMFGANPNERSVTNVPIQGAGSCILRKAVQLCQDAGLVVSIPLHDALYVEFDNEDWVGVDLFAEKMKEAFCFYFEGRDKEWASAIGLDIEAWGTGLTKGSTTTPNGRYVATEERHIDERALDEYAQFSKYFDTPDVDLI